MEIDWEGLTVAFAARSKFMNHFLDKATGEVHAHLNGSPELREALLHERSGRYLRIPKSTPDVDTARCMAFAPKMDNEIVRRKALAALQADGVNAFREALIASPNDEAAWFVFRDRRVREELKAWLAAQGIHADRAGPDDAVVKHLGSKRKRVNREGTWKSGGVERPVGESASKRVVAPRAMR